MGITVTPTKMPEDMRTCAFCHQVGDGVADGPSRFVKNENIEFTRFAAVVFFLHCLASVLDY